ncbi:MAG: hypothetical protein IJT58_07135 [Synergistaceae bacterium]|nr:hypothetical protein [Synergistaceae bacterium]
MYIDEDENKWLYSITKNADKVIAQVIKETRGEIAGNIFKAALRQAKDPEDDFLLRLVEACGITHQRFIEITHEMADKLLMSEHDRSMGYDELH